MNRIALLITLIFPFFSNAQMYMRKKQNFGVYAQYNISLEERNNTSFNLGITKQFGRYFLPEFGFRSSTITNLNREDLSSSTVHKNYLNLALIARVPVFTINERKKGRSCRAEIVEIFFAPEAYWNLPQTSSASNSFLSYKTGLGLYHVQSGFGKRNKAWTVKLEAYYRGVIRRQIQDNSINKEVGLQLRIIHYKTYDFVN
jgi:hypothetical protein